MIALLIYALSEAESKIDWDLMGIRASQSL